MSTLIAGYESDEDTQPVPSTSTSALPPLGTGFSVGPDDEDEDDEGLEEQAKIDAFGLSTAQQAERKEQREKEKRTEIMAAPDVLKEVSWEERHFADIADCDRIQMARGWRSLRDLQIRS